MIETASSNVRGAGILMHITSLPGPFGIGDLGPSARAFASKLQKSNQLYWQLLPLNATEEGNASPYSAMSAMAGNTLLISPELLSDTGLLKNVRLEDYYLPEPGRADYSRAREIKTVLLQEAWRQFQRGNHPELSTVFERYCMEQSGWLDDFARYMALMHNNSRQPWYVWQDNKEPAADTMAAEKFWQFIFDQQWQELRTFCNRLHIRLFGDIPFYMSHGAADVWAHPGLFKLDKNGQMAGIAGVPPDYFNAEGQLWNMPVYNWETLKTTGYDWWIKRIERNLAWFDLLRLDHFRAFSAYWEVPAGAITAITGSWQPAGGENFLHELCSRIKGPLPLVAEDLGQIDEKVYKLRDRFNMPGMRVLQFAFGKDMTTSPHIPHNYTRHSLAYTGTHDNNTSRGWYEQDAGKEERKRLSLYVGRRVAARNVARVLSNMVYASVADTVILPMQDVLELDGSARMNTPAGIANNWEWRMLPGQFNNKVIAGLRKRTILYNRKPVL